MRRYAFVLAALLLLTSLTLGLSFVPMGAWGPPVALTIAAAKSVLVILCFMHLGEHGTESAIALIVAVGLAISLVAFAWLDVGTRPAAPTPSDVGISASR